MPDRIIRRVEQLVAIDRQMGEMRLRNKRNERYEWDNDKEVDPDQMALIEDTAIEDERTAPFPNILAEMPGVLLEGDITTPAIINNEQTEEERARRALENANMTRDDLIVGEEMRRQQA